MAKPKIRDLTSWPSISLILGFLLLFFCIASDLWLYTFVYLQLILLILPATYLAFRKFAPGTPPETLKNNLFLPGAIPLGLILFILIWLELPQSTDLRADIVSDKLALSFSDGAEISGRANIEEIATSVSGASIEIAGARINPEATTIPPLKRIPAQGDLRITPRSPLRPGENTYYRIRVSSEGIPLLTIKLRQSPQEPAQRQQFGLHWDRLGDKKGSLRLSPTFIASASLSPSKFDLYVRNCIVSFGDLKIDVGNAAQTISGNIPLPTLPILFKLDSKNNEEVFDIRFRETADEYLAALKIGSGTFSNPVFSDVKRGRLAISGDRVINLEQEFMRRMRVDVSGSINEIREFNLKPDGLHVLIVARAQSIKVDEENQMRNRMELLLQANWLIAVLALIAWTLDKMLSFYLASKG